MSKEFSIIFERKNPIIEKRASQLIKNNTAATGGHDYVRAVLERFPNESDLSWAGSGHVPARYKRVSYIPDAMRITRKINDHLFANPATRDGADPSWLLNVGHGNDIGMFWERVSTEYTTTSWVWIGVDRTIPSSSDARTLAEREMLGDQISWTIWPALSVPDWNEDLDGELAWLITEEILFIKQDPFKPEKTLKQRTLWKRGYGTPATWTTFVETKDGAEIVSRGELSTEYVPFVRIGIPSLRPAWFDSVELLSTTIINLESLSIESIIKTAFPQIIISSAALNALEARLIERAGASNGARVVELVKEIVRGLDTPLVEDEMSKNITRFISPDVEILKIIPEQINTKRKQLYESVGLSLFPSETRLVQSAEALTILRIDTEQTLKNRAQAFERAENKLVQMSYELDNTFSVYTPVWPTTFTPVNFSSDNQVDN